MTIYNFWFYTNFTTFLLTLLLIFLQCLRLLLLRLICTIFSHTKPLNFSFAKWLSRLRRLSRPEQYFITSSGWNPYHCLVDSQRFAHCYEGRYQDIVSTVTQRLNNSRGDSLYKMGKGRWSTITLSQYYA